MQADVYNHLLRNIFESYTLVWPKIEDRKKKKKDHDRKIPTLYRYVRARLFNAKSA